MVKWAKTDATLHLVEQMITQAFENDGKFIKLIAVHSSLLSLICVAPTREVGSLIQVAKKRIDILRKLGVVKLTIGQEIVFYDEKVSESSLCFYMYTLFVLELI